ncbi:unnamed protein product [Linum trigynum]|uniref:Uncharacterized protein n=1 Tax=Linum trigynum TaxID=586398 RepID=A0AAV2DRM0_9ROSI
MRLKQNGSMMKPAFAAAIREEARWAADIAEGREVLFEPKRAIEKRLEPIIEFVGIRSEWRVPWAAWICEGIGSLEIDLW